MVGLSEKEEGRDVKGLAAKEGVMVGCANGHAWVEVSRWVAVVGGLAWLRGRWRVACTG